MYHDKSHPQHKEKKKIIDACRATLRLRDDGEEVSFDPSSEVTRCIHSGMTHYLDLAFLTDQDLIMFFKLSAKELGLKDKVVSRPNEDGSGLSEGLYVRLSDLPELTDRQVMGLRKTRIWCEVGKGEVMKG